MKKQHVGRSAHRLADNPHEKAFADAWREQNKAGNTLRYLLDGNGGPRGGFETKYSERDEEVAATVVQWLGSPVGKGFLREIIKANPTLREELT